MQRNLDAQLRAKTLEMFADEFVPMPIKDEDTGKTERVAFHINTCTVMSMEEFSKLRAEQRAKKEAEEDLEKHTLKRIADVAETSDKEPRNEQ